jgi:N-acetylglucosaminyl-diphospho-decaprenol L-rhamnosyltransferase
MSTDTAARPDLSVIVVTHNRLELALRTLACARAAGVGCATEWIVVDSGSDGDAVARLRAQCPYAQVLGERNIGFAAANNRALSIARGRYVLLLNPDAEVVSGTFADLLDALDAQPRIGAASVLQRAPDGRLLLSIRRFPSPLRAFGEAIAAARWTPLATWREEEPRACAYARQTSADWLVGAFLVVRAQALEQVGGLDERFFLYSEEADWCRRIARAGWDVAHIPRMTVVHHTETSTRPDLRAQLSWSKLQLARKHHGRVAAAGIRVALALRHALRAAAAQAAPAQRAHAAAERHALAVVLGIAPPPFAPPQGPRPIGPSTR